MARTIRRPLARAALHTVAAALPILAGCAAILETALEEPETKPPPAGLVGRWEVIEEVQREVKTKKGETGRYTSRQGVRVKTVAYAPDGRTAALGGENGSVHIWDVGASRSVRRVGAEPHAVRALAFSRDGRLLAAAAGKTTRLFDPASGREVRLLDRAGDDVEQVAFSPDGRWVLAADFGDDIRIFDASTGKVARKLGDAGANLAVSPDGRSVAAGDMDVQIFDMATGKAMRTLDSAELVECVAYAPDGKIAAGRGNAIDIWDPASGALVRTLSGHGAEVKRLAFSPDGRSLASGSADRTVRLWDVAAGKEVRSFAHDSPIDSISFAPDGARVVSCAGGTAFVWDASGN